MKKILYNSLIIKENNNYSSYSYSYIAKNNGNDTLVYESKKNNINGKTDKTDSTYKLDSKGNKIPIDKHKALQELNIKNNYLLNSINKF